MSGKDSGFRIRVERPLHEQFLRMVYVVVCQNRLARLLFLLPVWSLLPEMSKKLFVLWLHSNWSR